MKRGAKEPYFWIAIYTQFLLDGYNATSLDFQSSLMIISTDYYKNYIINFIIYKWSFGVSSARIEILKQVPSIPAQLP